MEKNLSTISNMQTSCHLKLAFQNMGKIQKASC